MYSNKSHKKAKSSIINSVANRKDNSASSAQYVDNRTKSIVQRKQIKDDYTSSKIEPIQKKSDSSNGVIQFGNGNSTLSGGSDDGGGGGGSDDRDFDKHEKRERLEIAAKDWKASEEEARERLYGLIEEQKAEDSKRDSLRSSLNDQVRDTVINDIGEYVQTGNTPGLRQSSEDTKTDVDRLTDRGNMQNELSTSIERDSEIDREIELAKSDRDYAIEMQVKVEKARNELDSDSGTSN